MQFPFPKNFRQLLIVLVALIGLGLFIYFFWFYQEESMPWEQTPGSTIPEEYQKDTFEPASQIKSPDSGAWQNRDFFINVLDEDLESGLDTKSCQYKVLSYEANGIEHSSGWLSRKCNTSNWVGAGLEKWCRFEGESACWVFISSKDKAGNQHLPAEEKGSVKYYHIDFIPPAVGKVVIESGMAKVSVSDNLKITACSLFLDKKNLGAMSFQVPGCQTECLALKAFSLSLEPGEHQVFAICQDAARNYGKGEELIIRENLPPQVSSCQVSPVQGSIGTQFQFKVEATDLDQDSLSFLWDFGDGEKSREMNPLHNYSKTGTFEPKVEVSDGKGGKDVCSTAWVIVNE